MKNSLCISFLLLMLSFGIQGCFENRQPEDTSVNYIKKPLYIELINFKDTSVFLVKYTSPVVYFYNGFYYYQDENSWKKTKFIGRSNWMDEQNVPQAIKTVSTMAEPNGEQFLRRIGFRQVAIHEPEDYSEIHIYSFWDFSDVYYSYNPGYRSYRRLTPDDRRHLRDGNGEHREKRRHHAHSQPGHHRPTAGEARHHRNRPHRPVPMVTSSSHGHRHPSSGARGRRHHLSSGSNSSGSSHSGYSGRSSRPSRPRDYSSSSGRSYGSRPSYSGSSSSSRPSYSGSSSSSRPSYSGSSSSSSRGSSPRFRTR